MSNTENNAENSLQFFDKLKTIPLVSDSLSYMDSKYSSLKDGKLLGTFIDGVAQSLTRVITGSYNISKGIISYGYFDNLACRGLNKVEETVPLITKPTSEVWTGCRYKVLSTLSGVEDAEEMPKNISRAVQVRTSNLITKASTKASETACGKKILSLSDRTIQSVDKAIDYALPSTEEKKLDINEGVGLMVKLGILSTKVRNGVSEAANRTKTSVCEIIGYAKTKTPLGMVKSLHQNVHYKLDDWYKKSKTAQSEGGINALIRIGTVTSTGILLGLMGTLDATLLKINNNVEEAENSDETYHRTVLESVPEDSNEEDSENETMVGANL